MPYTACTFIYFNWWSPYPSIIWSLKKVPFSGGASRYRILQRVPLGIIKQPWSKLLGRGRSSSSKWRISPPPLPLPPVHSCINTINITWEDGDSRNRLLEQHSQILLRGRIKQSTVVCLARLISHTHFVLSFFLHCFVILWFNFILGFNFYFPLFQTHYHTIPRAKKKKKI